MYVCEKKINILKTSFKEFEKEKNLQQKQNQSQLNNPCIIQVYSYTHSNKKNS